MKNFNSSEEINKRRQKKIKLSFENNLEKIKREEDRKREAGKIKHNKNKNYINN